MRCKMNIENLGLPNRLLTLSNTKPRAIYIQGFKRIVSFLAKKRKTKVLRRFFVF